MPYNVFWYKHCRNVLNIEENPIMNSTTNRRKFIETTLAAVAAAGLPAGKTWSATAVPPVCVFSKHLQFLNYKKLAQTCREIGLDGVDLTVRSGGHVLPENVTRDLPKAVETIRAEGLKVPMITTRLVDGNDPDAVPILKTASSLGIKYFRIGGAKYDLSKPILPQLDKFAAGLRRLADVAERYDISAGYHNHSGTGQVGGPVWDLYRMIQTVGSPNIGSNLDVGHVTAEGMSGAWQVAVRLIAPYVKMMSIKDFVPDPKGRRPVWVPIGKGIVKNVDILKVMRDHKFHGPISIHVEYKVPSGDAMIDEIHSAVSVVRNYLKQAGF